MVVLMFSKAFKKVHKKQLITLLSNFIYSLPKIKFIAHTQYFNFSFYQFSNKNTIKITNLMELHLSN